MNENTGTSLSLYTKRNITIFDRSGMQSGSALIVSEMPLTIFLNDVELVTLTCSPGAGEELAAGFLLSEGLVQSPADIREITCCEEEGLLRVRTNSPVFPGENFLRRHIAVCCGKGRAAPYIASDALRLQPVQSSNVFAAPHLLQLMVLLDEKSATFRLTGGVHCAALADGRDLLVMYEDIGRHNAVDKVLGHAFLRRIAPADKCLLLSGRISSEIIIKAVRSGIPLVVSRSAPTLLAVDLAEQLGIALVGFARGQRLNVYSHKEKVVT